MDLIGERWSMPLIRELMLGPRRFGDLKTSLNGISANVLTQRLEGLEAAGVLDHYAVLWGEPDARFILTGLSNALYRLLSISVPGLLTLFMQHDPTLKNEALTALQQRLAVITQIITATQIHLQGSPGYIEGPVPSEDG